MKKFISLLLAVVMIGTMVPMTAFARNAYIAYDPTEGCQMNSISFTQADNPWLLWDVTFAEADGETVLKTEKDHPNLVSAEVVPSIDFEGTTVTFNGKTIVDGDAVKLKAENEIVIADEDNHNFAEYTLIVTEETNGLPVVLIDTDGADIPDKLNYVDASISVIGADIYDGKDIYSAVAGIKLRGNSTMSYAKKPYRIKFDKKQNVLGLGKAKSWVLLADYLDPSALRNQIAYNLADRVNKFTAETTGFEVFSPRMKLVEVYLNGEFKGMYEMGDHMQANELRVDVSELGDEDPNAKGEDVGYFIEVEVKDRVLKEGKDGYEDWSAYSYVVDVLPEGQWYPQEVDEDDVENGYVINEDDIGKSVMYFQFKLPEEPSDEQKDYITEQMQTINDLLMQGDEAVWDLLDMDSVIDWYLVNELFKNADSQMQSSVYFFKNGLKDTDGNPYENPNTKLYMGPVWDFDLGAGGVSYGSMDDPTGWRTNNDEYCAWFKKMFEMDSFQAAVEQRWADLHEEGILDALFTDISYLEAFAGDAAVDNFDLWHNTYLEEIDGTWMTVPAVSTGSNNWETHVDYFESYLKARIGWIDEQYGYSEKTTLATKNEDVDTLTFTASKKGNVSQTYTVNKDVTVDQLALKLDMTSTAKWNVAFNFTVKATVNGQNKTITLTPSTKNDWQSEGSAIFPGTTGAYHAAGTYTDREFTIAGAISWNLKTYHGATDITKDNLSEYVTSIHLNTVTVELNDAVAGDTATFSLKNAATGKTALSIDKTVIAGKPSILGEPVSGMTLFASNTEMRPYNAPVTYQWYADGTAISGATGNSYKMTNSDIGKTITVKATGTDMYTGTLTSDGKTVVKYQRTSTYSASDIQLDAVTVNSITVSCPTYTGVEFSIDGETWQADGTFTDLESNKVYNVYIRAGEHGTGTAGIACGPLVVTTLVGETVKGDINGSGKIDTTDAVWVLDHALDFAEMTNETVLDLSDVNSDGKINTLDARLILKAIVNSTDI